MSLFDIMVEVEHQGVYLERARAVLLAATEEVQDYSKYKAFRDEHATLLLHAADHLLFEILPELKQITDTLMEKHKVVEQLTK